MLQLGTDRQMDERTDRVGLAKGGSGIVQKSASAAKNTLLFHYFLTYMMKSNSHKIIPRSDVYCEEEWHSEPVRSSTQLTLLLSLTSIFVIQHL